MAVRQIADSQTRSVQCDLAIQQAERGGENTKSIAVREEKVGERNTCRREEEQVDLIEWLGLARISFAATGDSQKYLGCPR
jgi:hypothetical protein